MRLVVVIDIGDEPRQEALQQMLGSVPGKVMEILGREEGCVCSHRESADLIRDVNGNRVGTVTLMGEDRVEDLGALRETLEDQADSLTGVLVNEIISSLVEASEHIEEWVSLFRR